MLDLLYTLHSIDGTANNNTPQCAWQDLPGRFKYDNDDNEVTLTASYKHSLQTLKHGAPPASNALQDLATAADNAGQPDAARDARVARGWLGRLSRQDFTTTTWDADHSRLDGFWACLRDTQVQLERRLRSSQGEESPLQVLARYVDDLAPLQAQIDAIERSRTTLAQKVFRRLSGTMAALRSGEVVNNDKGFWDEESVGSSTR